MFSVYFHIKAADPSAVTQPHLPASALSLTSHCGSRFSAKGQGEEEGKKKKKAEPFLKKPYLFLSCSLNLHKAGSNQILPGLED